MNSITILLQLLLLLSTISISVSFSIESIDYDYNPHNSNNVNSSSKSNPMNVSEFELIANKDIQPAHSNNTIVIPQSTAIKQNEFNSIKYCCHHDHHHIDYPPGYHPHYRQYPNHFRHGRSPEHQRKIWERSIKERNRRHRKYHPWQRLMDSTTAIKELSAQKYRQKHHHHHHQHHHQHTKHHHCHHYKHHYKHHHHHLNITAIQQCIKQQQNELKQREIAERHREAHLAAIEADLAQREDELDRYKQQIEAEESRQSTAARHREWIERQRESSEREREALERARELSVEELAYTAQKLNCCTTIDHHNHLSLIDTDSATAIAASTEGLTSFNSIQLISLIVLLLGGFVIIIYQFYKVWSLTKRNRNYIVPHRYREHSIADYSTAD